MRFHTICTARRAAMIALSMALPALLVGCHRPQGALMAYTGGSQTYFSTETLPKSVQLIDTRSDEILFAMDIPTGKQLTLQFLEGDGDDPAATPDLMIYEVLDLGTETGKLHNSLSVPGPRSRRIDVALRGGVEYMTAAPERELRTDELADRPDWWTPAGGEMPKDPRGLTIYHD